MPQVSAQQISVVTTQRDPTSGQTGRVHHQQIFGMVSEQPLHHRSGYIHDWAERGVMLDLWIESNGIEVLDQYRSFRNGDQHAVYRTRHPRYGEVVLKTFTVHDENGRWNEGRVCRAILRAQRELGIRSFAVPDPLDIVTMGDLGVFFYRPLDGTTLAESGWETFNAASVTEDIHALARTHALHSMRGGDVTHQAYLVVQYLEQLQGSGLQFSLYTLDAIEHRFSLAARTFNAYPRIFLHGDFHAANILRLADGRVGIIDWEFARIGHALEDDAARFVERIVLGASTAPVLQEVNDAHPSMRAVNERVLTALAIKQVLKRIFFARIRRTDARLESDYLAALSVLLDEDASATRPRARSTRSFETST